MAMADISEANGNAEVTETTTVKKRKHRRLFDDMLLLFLITFAYAAFNFEAYIPQDIMKYYVGFTGVVFFASWLVISFLNGSRKKRNYVLFAALFWLVPQFIIFLASSGPRFFTLSVTMYVLSEFSAVMTSIPLAGLFNAVGLGSFAAAFVFLLVNIFCFLGGMLFSMKNDHR